MERSSSELILSGSGSIYHLDLFPGDLGNIILTVGDPARVSKVSACFDHIELKRSHREFTTHTGRIGSQRISCISTGMGLDNIDIFWNELDALFNVDLDTGNPKEEITSLKLIRLGTSGSVDISVPVDSLLVSNGAISSDSLWNYYPEAEDFKIPSKSGEDLWYFPSTLPLSGDEFLFGITRTSPGFYGPQGRSLRLRHSTRNMPEPLEQWTIENGPVVNLEMETAGLFGLGTFLGHQVASVNAILAQRDAGTFSKDPEMTIDRMIRVVLDQIQ